jgi:uncharacterized protein YndB with AHSA1/START domain
MKEVTIADTISLSAPITAVWREIEDPTKHAHWHPFVSAIDGQHALGEARECTVLVGEKAGRTRERCVEFEPGRRIFWTIEVDSTGFARMVTDWCAGFSLSEQDGATKVTAESRFRPRNIAVRAILPLIRGRFHQTQRNILGGLEKATWPVFEP